MEKSVLINKMQMSRVLLQYLIWIEQEYELCWHKPVSKRILSCTFCEIGKGYPHGTQNEVGLETRDNTLY